MPLKMKMTNLAVASGKQLLNEQAGIQEHKPLEHGVRYAPSFNFALHLGAASTADF